MLPKELESFLEEARAKTFRCEEASKNKYEIIDILFKAPEETTVSDFEVYTCDYYLNHDEEGDDPDLSYPIKGIDLVANCGENYGAEGILVYLVELNEFGVWDCDHFTLQTFPGKSWANILDGLFDYVNSQWEPDLVDCVLLRPWADPRCENIQPKPIFES